MEWIAFILVGVNVGLTASVMVRFEDLLVEAKRKLAMGFIDKNIALAWLTYIGVSIVCVIVAVLMTVYWGKGSKGSGISELMAYMNGVNYPNTFGFEVYTTKVFGTLLAVVGGLCVGKEGPMAHIGANIGIAVLYLPLPKFEFFRNDVSKRHLIAAGTSAGVSAAFGSPIGGALFAYEISKPNTFWKFSVIWKVYCSCAVAVLVLALLH
jgi:chloride channel 7